MNPHRNFVELSSPLESSKASNLSPELEPKIHYLVPQDCGKVDVVKNDVVEIRKVSHNFILGRDPRSHFRFGNVPPCVTMLDNAVLTDHRRNYRRVITNYALKRYLIFRHVPTHIAKVRRYFPACTPNHFRVSLVNQLDYLFLAYLAWHFETDFLQHKDL